MITALSLRWFDTSVPNWPAGRLTSLKTLYIAGFGPKNLQMRFTQLIIDAAPNLEHIIGIDAEFDPDLFVRAQQRNFEKLRTFLLYFSELASRHDEYSPSLIITANIQPLPSVEYFTLRTASFIESAGYWTKMFAKASESLRWLEIDDYGSTIVTEFEEFFAVLGKMPKLQTLTFYNFNVPCVQDVAPGQEERYISYSDLFESLSKLSQVRELRVEWDLGLFGDNTVTRQLSWKSIGLLIENMPQLRVFCCSHPIECTSFSELLDGIHIAFDSIFNNTRQQLDLLQLPGFDFPSLETTCVWPLYLENTDRWNNATSVANLLLSRAHPATKAFATYNYADEHKFITEMWADAAENNFIEPFVIAISGINRPFDGAKWRTGRKNRPWRFHPTSASRVPAARRLIALYYWCDHELSLFSPASQDASCKERCNECEHEHFFKYFDLPSHIPRPEGGDRHSPLLGPVRNY